MVNVSGYKSKTITVHFVTGFIFSNFPTWHWIHIKCTRNFYIISVYSPAPSLITKATSSFCCAFAVIIHPSLVLSFNRPLKGLKNSLMTAINMADQFWKEPHDEGICIFSSVAVRNYRRTEQKEDERKDNQREQIIERSAGGARRVSRVSRCRDKAFLNHLLRQNGTK